MDLKQLTRKQKLFFEYIRDFYHDHGIWPTYREIADEFGFRSPNSVTQNLQALLKKGFLVKAEDGEYLLPEELSRQESGDDEGIPVRGIIAAGYLQEAVEANLGKITLKHLLPGLDKMYALRVSGYSMRDVGVMDGDFVLLMDDDVKDGDIGAVLYNGETSLKRIFYGPNGLRLEPTNDAFSDIDIEPDIFEEVRVLGRYVGHVNRSGFYRKRPD